MTDGQALQDVLRRLPGVDAVLASPAGAAAVERHGHRLVVAEVRRRLDELRHRAREGALDALALAQEAGAQAIAERAAQRLDARARGALTEVLNATGVVVHTNLGRAPLGAGAARRAAERAQGSADLELDLATGRRGRRAPGVEDLLVELTGAEAACVVNNNAAALLLALNTLALGRGVVVSRGELVEIGGSFRIPDVCARSGAHLVEVGTTNRTRAADYARALEPGHPGPPAAVLLKVHPSNFRIEGFVEEASLDELVELGRARGVPVVMDQGSGLLEDLSAFGVEGETPVPRLVAAGPDLTLFSGDKLLGGPQAGCLVGSRAVVGACRANPLYRALRVGRLVASALEATLWAHATGRWQEVPVLARIREDAASVARRAGALAARLTEAVPGLAPVVEPGWSTSGGGSSPTSRIATTLVRVEKGSADALAERLRLGRPAVMARVADGAVVLDVRTVPPERDADLAAAVIAALAG